MTTTATMAVIPAQAGIQTIIRSPPQWDDTSIQRCPLRGFYGINWIPACAGMTNFLVLPAVSIYVTAFPDRGEIFRKFLAVVAWETEVWCASDPTHLIHFNGIRFLGPYLSNK